MKYKLGLRPPSNKPAILFRDIRRVLPAHPPMVDYLAPFTNWQMLGNDDYGNCAAVMWANERRTVTGTLATECYPTLEQVFAVYKSQNPGFPYQDDGMELQALLEYLNKTGGADGVKAVAFAKVHPQDLEEIKAAIAIFGTLCLGIAVQEANDEQFSRGLPWDYVPNSYIAGYHAVLGGGYSPNAFRDVEFITWARQTAFTDAFWLNLVFEAWAVIFPENLGTKQFQAGIDLTKLADAYLAITDRPLPLPTPPPIPVPPPLPDGCRTLIARMLRLT
jgi:hypothetical protein